MSRYTECPNCLKDKMIVPLSEDVVPLSEDGDSMVCPLCESVY